MISLSWLLMAMISLYPIPPRMNQHMRINSVFRALTSESRDSKYWTTCSSLVKVKSRCRKNLSNQMTLLLDKFQYKTRIVTYVVVT
jgi:hypothetical protein